jgi:hypothetical protein
MFKTITILSLSAFLVATSALAGPPSGGLVGADIVPARSTMTYTVFLNGGEPTRVIVSGDGDTDLDLYVNDQNGVCVAQDTDYTDDCIAMFVPRWSGYFTIRVVNLGNVYNEFDIAIW